MVYAAWRRKLPAALTEADAHLGLANRLAAPFARRVFLAYGIAGRDGSKYRVTGRPVPAAHLGVSQEEGRRRFGLSGERARARVLRRARRRAQPQRVRGGDATATSGPTVLHVSGERDYEGLRGRVHRDDYVLVRLDERVRRRARRSRSRDLARGRHGLGARRGGHACDPRPVSARDGRPPDAERTPLRAWRRRRRRPGARARARARRWSTSCSPTGRGSSRCARRCCRWRGRTPRTRSRRS